MDKLGLVLISTSALKGTDNFLYKLANCSEKLGICSDKLDLMLSHQYVEKSQSVIEIPTLDKV